MDRRSLAGRRRLVKIRTTQVEAARLADRFAAVAAQFTRTIRAEHGNIFFLPICTGCRRDGSAIGRTRLLLSTRVRQIDRSSGIHDSVFVAQISACIAQKMANRRSERVEHWPGAWRSTLGLADVLAERRFS